MADLAAYLKANKKNVEVLVGVVLPVVMLFVFERIKKRGDPRALDVAKRREDMDLEDSSDVAPVPFDPFPARMVMVSLLVMGVWMLGIGFFGDEGRGPLLGFAAVLLALAGLVWRGIRGLQQSAAPNNEE